MKVLQGREGQNRRRNCRDCGAWWPRGGKFDVFPEFSKKNREVGSSSDSGIPVDSQSHHLEFAENATKQYRFALKLNVCERSGADIVRDAVCLVECSHANERGREFDRVENVFLAPSSPTPCNERRRAEVGMWEVNDDSVNEFPGKQFHGTKGGE